MLEINSKVSCLLLSRPVMSNSLQHHGLQHARPCCSSPSPRICPSSCSLHRWRHPAISFSDSLFFFYLQSFPASGTFPMSCLCASDDKNTRASGSVSPVNIQGWSPLRLTGLISLLSKGLSRVFSNSLKPSILWCSAFFTVQPSYPYITTGKTFDHIDLCW